MKRFTSTLLFVGLALSASAQWSDDNMKNYDITPFDRKVYGMEIQSTDEGTTYVNYNGPVGDNINTWLQILDKEGNKKFEGDGMLISDTTTYTWTQVNELLFTDSDGNAVVIVSDCRNDVPNGAKNLNYTLYKVSPEGEMLWGKDGKDLHRGGSSFVACIKAIQLEDGSYVFAWQEGIFYGETPLNCIRVERISKDGELLWDEPLVITNEESTYECPLIENAGNNQFILVYAQGGNENIYARKVDFDGSSVWAEDTKVYVGGFNAQVPLYSQITTERDPNGGVFIAWSADPYFTMAESPYLSYVQADGKLKFADGTAGLKIAYSDIRCLNVDIVYNETEDCIYAIWRGIGTYSSSFQSMNIQKITREGEVLWDAAGVEVEPVDRLSFGPGAIHNAKDGNFTIFYSQFVTYKDTQNRAIMLDKDANALWNYDFSPIETYKGGLKVSPLVNNEYWLAAWQEDRVDDGDLNYAVYADRIYLNGSNSAGVAEVENDAAKFAVKTTDGAVTFATNSYEPATITIYTAAGEMVATLAANSNTVSYNTAGLATGVYIATLQGGNVASSTRFVVK